MHPMASLPNVIIFVSLFTGAISHCPPSQGIYLRHSGYCIPEYAAISRIALTVDNPLHCVLPGGTGGGQWTTVSGNTTVCGEPDSEYPLTCSQYSNNITLYKTGAPFTRNQLYTCTISGQSISVQIKNNTVLSAIYIEPPTDMRSVPQNYTIHCITIGQRPDRITVEVFLEKYDENETNGTEATTYNQSLSDPVLLDTTTNTYDYSTEVSWSADKVETTATEFSDYGLTRHNGDHGWICRFQENSEFLQSYIRAPNSSPSNLDVCDITGINVTICWTAINATEADGYVVYYETATTEVTNATDVGNITQYALGEHERGKMHIFSVRAYQDLLGIASAPLTIVLDNSTITVNGSVVAGIVNMTWTLLNRYTSNKEVQYRIDCITRNTSIEQLHWTKNGNTLANGTSNLQTLMIGGDRTFVVITTMEYESAVITCSNQQFSRSIVVEAPSGPPSNVWVVFQSSSSITVNWSPPVGGADGYVILYSVEGTSNMTLLVEGGDQTSSLLTGLSKGHLYTISMFAYKNLNSQPSHPMNAVILEIPDPILVGLVFGGTNVTLSISLGNVTILNTTGVLGYTFRLSSHSCAQLKVAHTESKNITSLNNTLLITQPLHPGLTYNITVAVDTPIGSANYSIVDYASYRSVPAVAPLLYDATAVNSSAIAVNWKPVACFVSNGEIIQYQIRFASNTGTSAVALVSGKETSHVITGLENFTKYDISIAATTASGTGPFSHNVSVTTLYNEYLTKPLEWALLSDRTSPQVHYQVNCTTERTDANWIKNGIVVVNSSTLTMSRYVVNYTTEVIVNILTVTENDYTSQTITCSITNGGNTLSDTVIIDGSSESPRNVRAEILTMDSILVSWSVLKNVNGYVISYNDEGGNSSVQLMDSGAHSFVIENLIKGHTYNITMFSYKDLPSPPSESVQIKLDVPDQITVEILPNTNVLTLALNRDSAVQYTNCTISFYNSSCPDGVTTSVTIPAQQTHYSVTLQSGQTYNINVSTSNPIGTSSPESFKYSVPVYKIPASPPLDVLQAVVNLTALKITWSAVQCLDSNGAINSYVVVYTGAVGSADTLNVPSTETSVVLTNLTPHSQYSIRVAASNKIGAGPFSDPILTSTTTGPIQSLMCATANQSSITLVWSRIQYSYNTTNSIVQVGYTSLTDCMVTSETSGTRKTMNASQNHAVIDSLTPQTCYLFTVGLIAGNGNEDTIMCKTADDPIPAAYVASIVLLASMLLVTAIVIITLVTIVTKRLCRKRRQSWNLLPTAGPYKLSRSPVIEMKESTIYDHFSRGNAIYDSIRYAKSGGGKNDNKTTENAHVYDRVQLEKTTVTEQTSSL